MLVDGGAANPLPWNDLLDDCDVTVAINVTGKRFSRRTTSHFLDSVFNTFQIMQSTIINEKLARAAPTVYIETDIVDVRALEVQKRDQVYAGARPAKHELKRRLEALLRDAGAGRTRSKSPASAVRTSFGITAMCWSGWDAPWRPPLPPRGCREPLDLLVGR
ncbi:MAG: hypothetical protein U5L11_12995 [Arhodomonas sp.]|nr:hypothetical protein [Arhodomonas sp.]